MMPESNSNEVIEWFTLSLFTHVTVLPLCRCNTAGLNVLALPEPGFISIVVVLLDLLELAASTFMCVAAANGIAVDKVKKRCEPLRLAKEKIGTIKVAIKIRTPPVPKYLFLHNIIFYPPSILKLSIIVEQQSIKGDHRPKRFSEVGCKYSHFLISLFLYSAETIFNPVVFSFYALFHFRLQDAVLRHFRMFPLLPSQFG